MTFFNQESLTSLIETQPGRCVSIFLPTHEKGTEIQQDPIRLKNLIDDVERQLGETELRNPVIRDQLAPARQLLGDTSFWQHQSAGLSLFGADGQWQYFHLPFSPPEISAVGSRFHILPLLPLTEPYGLHYVLAVSLRQVRLFVGSRRGLVEWETETLQFGMEEALALDMERQLQLHSQRPSPNARAGSGSGIYHGHEDVDPKRYILEYFRRIDDALEKLLSGESAPLIFAGVDYLFPIYREANTYPTLLGEPITGNFDDAPARELHDPAWEMLRPRVDSDKQQAISQLQGALGTGRASQDLTELLPAAFNARIDRLFVRPQKTCWGRYDRGSGEITLDDTSTAENDDLINLLVIETLRSGGSVYPIAEDADVQWDVAAMFRFAAVEPQASLRS